MLPHLFFKFQPSLNNSISLHQFLSNESRFVRNENFSLKRDNIDNFQQRHSTNATMTHLSFLPDHNDTSPKLPKDEMGNLNEDMDVVIPGLIDGKSLNNKKFLK